MHSFEYRRCWKKVSLSGFCTLSFSSGGESLMLRWESQYIFSKLFWSVLITDVLCKQMSRTNICIHDYVSITPLHPLLHGPQLIIVHSNFPQKSIKFHPTPTPIVPNILHPQTQFSFFISLICFLTVELQFEIWILEYNMERILFCIQEIDIVRYKVILLKHLLSR